ncbi:hypothetical protein [Mangrovicoccus algicola]|uniref:Uncharacterized protein n=1 Tax=Mangrovicoccus algicola TaxID=2771008 RepID=A0A8J6ZB91_9RHOB|nr:hypothetical protein [Mangrovicoccus algicola]MBE3639581.1 hypothetical protein [Mangrovicoccus algicola]
MTRKTALVLLALLIVALYAVPYLFIGQIADWQASFLFWTVAGVAVIVLNAVAMAGYGKDDE